MAHRKSVIEKNLSIFKRFEKQLGYRSQRENKDVNRMINILEKV